MACPNINLDSWKNLVAARGEDVAYYLWDKYDGKVPESESKSEIVKSGLKATNALQSDRAIQLFNTLQKNKVTGDAFWNKIQSDLQIPKDQINLLKQYNTTDREQLITNMLADYSFAIEINIAEEISTSRVTYDENGPSGEVSEPYKTGQTSSYYSNLTVPGGTNYTENEIATPAITPSIKGHAQFATDQGIGWFRSDDKMSEKDTKTLDKKISELSDVGVSERDIEGGFRLEKGEGSKTRRILEVQSDLFQKGRDKKSLTETLDDTTGYGGGPAQAQRWRESISSSENQFLQLLNKANNWVTFFVKSIIQDSAKKGYEKVVFPTGPTAYKVESGGNTIEDYIKNKENRLEELEEQKKEAIIPFEELEDWQKKVVREEGGNFFRNDKSPEAIDREIDQVKKEIEDVKAGVSGLAATARFYQETVANVLRKQGYNPRQVTDEYGNTWNEVELESTRDQQKIVFQLDTMSASKASEETLNKVKEAAKKMGIDIQALTDYVKAHPEIDTKSVNGVADMVKGIVAIAEGRADVALTEEMVHLATAILEQTNPKLVTEMISKIGRFKIYKQVFEAYKGRKEYQLSDGKPDIRKIKKEAVDKLIAEVIINRSEGSTEFPELMEEENRSFVQKLWEAIKDIFRGMYKKADINIFEEAAAKIMGTEDIGSVADITEKGVFLQVANPLVDSHYDKFKSADARLELVPKVGDKKRHYLLDKVKEVAKTVTEKIKEAVGMPERTGLDKFLDEQKRDWGSAGHKYLEDYIRQNLVDDKGYARTTPLNVPIDSKIDKVLTDKIEAFAKELIASYAPGTRFLLETKAVNEKVKGMLASTIDFIAIEPVKTADGKDDVKVDILDWKFSNINKSRTEDIPWYKQDEWKKQMGEYVKMAINYGISPKQIRKARMVPFIAGYTNKVKDTPSAGLNLTSLEVGKLDNVKETNLYLLPVPVNSESTGNQKIDSLLDSLRQYYDKVWETVVSPEEKSAKNLKLEQISRAIRTLHLKLDFSPLVGVGRTFLESATKTLNEFDGMDFSKLSLEELRKKLGDLLDYQRSAEKFTSLDGIFLSHVSKEKLTEEDKNTLTWLERISNSTDRMLDRINAIQREFVVQLALKEGVTTEQTKMSVLDAEIEVDGLSKTFLEGSKLSPMIIRIASGMIMDTKRLATLKTKELIEEFGKLLLPLEQQASSQGKSAFDMIGKVENGKLSLIKKISKAFWDAKTKASEAKNRQFFIDNMDMELYKKLSEEAINKEIDELDAMTFSTDPEENDSIRNYKIKKIKDSLDISRSTFNGYEYWKFNDIFNKTMFEEKHLSDDYRQMSKNEAALKVWNFMVALNMRARQSGYLSKQANSFFPLMEASILQKMFVHGGQGRIKDFFQDMYTVRVNEERGYGKKTDPETGEIAKRIPTYFTRTDKDVSKLSRDLTKVGSLWIKALIDYETSKSLEFSLLTMHSVEKSKGNILVDSSRNVIMEGGVPKVGNAVSKNADLLQTIIDDEVYGITENLNSLGNSIMNMAIGKMTKGEEAKESRVLTVKKIMQNSNILTQALAIGWKATIAIPNYLGYHLQMMINKGDFYRGREFEKNHIRLVTGLTTIEKGLLDMVVPLTEDIALEERRKIAKKQGYIKWLGTWNFSDVMMATNAFPEKKLQLTNALSMIQNSMVVDGKIVNIRQYVRKQDRERYKTMGEADRKALEKTQEDRIAKLKEEKSLLKTAKIKNDKIVLDGVSDEEIAKFSVKVVEYGRNMNGMMNNDNKADYRRDTIFRSFMMFKNWIPKQLYVRGGDIQKNNQLDEWEYGRTRLFIKTWSQLGFKNILDMRKIVQGTDEGLRLMDELLQEKKQSYFKKTGKELEITNEEFYDLVRTQLSRQARELGLLISIAAFIIAAKAMLPPDDEDKLANNRFKYFSKILNKTQDELAFYYNPLSFDSITKGSLFPFLGVLTKTEKVIEHVSREAYGMGRGDEKIIERAHPAKYFMDMIPGISQFNRELLPIIDPEMAKELGIRVTEQARIR